MTRLAIIGGGIAGRSLLYALAKRKKSYSEITLFDSDSFAHTCSLRSTAIVAPRGLTSGHSDLGDLLLAAFNTFSNHASSDLPAGVFPITQYTGAITKLHEFKKRYPKAGNVKNFLSFELHEEVHMTTEKAFLIDPTIYLEWLMDQSSSLPLKIKNDFVTGVDEIPEGLEIKTQDGLKLIFDSVIFAGGSSNRFWNEHSNKELANIKAVQGSYLEFKNIHFGDDSFSLTLEGHNLIYHAHTKKLLLGSTTMATHGEIPATNSLLEIYQEMQSYLKLQLPKFSSAIIQTGIREKAPKRSPYIKHNGKCWWIGGYYKNGFSLSYDWANKLISRMDIND